MGFSKGFMSRKTLLCMQSLLLESMPIGTLADSHVGILLKSSPVGTLVDLPCGGLSLPIVGMLVDLRGGPLAHW